MIAQRFTGTAFVDLSSIKRWTGSAFVDVGFGKRWTGTVWEQFWPFPGPPGGGGLVGPYNLDEATVTLGATFNLTKTVQGL